jgi:hypothetical protein
VLTCMFVQVSTEVFFCRRASDLACTWFASAAASRPSWSLTRPFVRTPPARIAAAMHPEQPVFCDMNSGRFEELADATRGAQTLTA